MSRDSLSEVCLKFCSIMRYKRQTKLALVIFPKICFWGNRAQSGLKLHNLISHQLLQGFQKHSSMMCCNSQILVIFVNFPKNSFFRPVAVQAKMVEPYPHDLLCGNFFETTNRDGMQQLLQNNFGQFSKKYPFVEVIRTQFGPKLCNPLSYDLLFVDFSKNFQHRGTQQVYNGNNQFCQNISFWAKWTILTYFGQKLCKNTCKN